MREQTRQVDQERWRLTQEESRLRALQAALEDERWITMDQLSAQRAEVMGDDVTLAPTSTISLQNLLILIFVLQKRLTLHAQQRSTSYICVSRFA